MKSSAPHHLPEVNFSDHGDIRYLHLGTEWVQGSMRLDDPFSIHLEYVQRMMAWLLFVDPATVARRHAMQLGLGAASLTKFCHRKLRMKTTAIELNPQVVAACRLWFRLPRDDSRLSVVLGDAAEVVAHEHWRGQVDALQVDLYDHEAAAPVLDSQEFYADCRRLLTEDGCMTVNLFGRSSSYERSLDRICAVFGEQPAAIGVELLAVQHRRRGAHQVLPPQAAHEDHGDRAQPAGDRRLPAVVQAAARRQPVVGGAG